MIRRDNLDHFTLSSNTDQWIVEKRQELPQICTAPSLLGCFVPSRSDGAFSSRVHPHIEWLQTFLFGSPWQSNNYGSLFTTCIDKWTPGFHQHLPTSISNLNDPWQSRAQIRWLNPHRTSCFTRQSISQSDHCDVLDPPPHSKVHLFMMTPRQQIPGPPPVIPSSLPSCQDQPPSALQASQGEVRPQSEAGLVFGICGMGYVFRCLLPAAQLHMCILSRRQVRRLRTGRQLPVLRPRPRAFPRPGAVARFLRVGTSRLKSRRERSTGT